MSRSFLGFGQTQYIGQPYTRPIKLGPINGVAVPLLFQWISYGASSGVPNINVLVDLSQAPCKALDQIRSVYIDNLGSPVPVYVYFPDTFYTITAKANSEGWYPAFTNAKQIWVVGEGFLTGNIPQTTITLSNFPLPPNVNTELDQALALWLASPVITRGTSIYNTAFGTPALGDQLSTTVPFSLALLNNTVGLWGTPYPSGFIYLTSLEIGAVGFGADSTSGQINIESTGVAGILISPQYGSFRTGSGASQAGVIPITNLQGLQIKLDATQTWRARVATITTGGVGQVVSSFTQQP
jgi:hypothetical protein